MKLAITTLGLLTLTTVSAFATTNLVYPVTGDAFRSGSSAGQTALYYDYGYLYNTGTGSLVVEAPLGHDTGAQRAFTLWGYNTAGLTLSCNIVLRNTTTGAPYAGAAANGTAAGFIQLPMTSPSVPAGDYTYDVSCLLPPNDATIIFGIGPTGTSSYFTPITGDAFHTQTAQQDLNIQYVEGKVFSIGGQQWIEGSLGVGVGGTQGFYFNGADLYASGSLTCYVEAVDYTNFNSYQYSNTITLSQMDVFHLLVTAAPPPGHYIYTGGCVLPSASLWVTGATPSSGNIDLLLPTSGDAFHEEYPTYQSDLSYSWGAMQTDANAIWVDAPLGHYIGAGSTTFTVTGYNAGGTGISCLLGALSQIAPGDSYQTILTTSKVGPFSLPINVVTDNSNFIYSMTCYLDAAGSAIYGVTPSK